MNSKALQVLIIEYRTNVTKVSCLKHNAYSLLKARFNKVFTIKRNLSCMALHVHDISVFGKV